MSDDALLSLYDKEFYAEKAENELSTGELSNLYRASRDQVELCLCLVAASADETTQQAVATTLEYSALVLERLAQSWLTDEYIPDKNVAVSGFAAFLLEDDHRRASAIKALLRAPDGGIFNPRYKDLDDVMSRIQHAALAFGPETNWGQVGYSMAVDHSANAKQAIGWFVDHEVARAERIKPKEHKGLTLGRVVSAATIALAAGTTWAIARKRRN